MLNGRGAPLAAATSARRFSRAAFHAGTFSSAVQWSAAGASPVPQRSHGAGTSHQGLTLAHFRAQLEDLRDASLTSMLNLSTFGTHPRVRLGLHGGPSKLKLG